MCVGVQPRCLPLSIYSSSLCFHVPLAWETLTGISFEGNRLISTVEHAAPLRPPRLMRRLKGPVSLPPSSIAQIARRSLTCGPVNPGFPASGTRCAVPLLADAPDPVVLAAEPKYVAVGVPLGVKLAP